MSKLRNTLVVDYVSKSQLDVVTHHRNDKEYMYANMPSNVLRVKHRRYVTPCDANEVRTRINKLNITNRPIGKLIGQLAWTRPNWTFVMTEKNQPEYNNAELITTDEFMIFDKLEAIGLVEESENWDGGPHHIHITNNRIKQDLSNQSSRITTKVKRAVQIINKDVYRLTVEELLSTSSKAIAGKMDSANSSLSMALRRRFDPISEWVRQQLLSKSPQFIELAEKMGSADIVSAFTKAADSNALGLSVVGNITAGKGKMVVILEDEYHIAAMGGLKFPSDNFNKRFIKYRREGLPEELHTALALLKLTEPNTFINGVGFKASATEFFIVEEVNLGFE